MKRSVRRIRVLALIVVAAMLLIPFWIFVVAPQLTKIPGDFTEVPVAQNSCTS